MFKFFLDPLEVPLAQPLAFDEVVFFEDVPAEFPIGLVVVLACEAAGVITFAGFRLATLTLDTGAARCAQGAVETMIVFSAVRSVVEGIKNAIVKGGIALKTREA